MIMSSAHRFKWDTSDSSTDEDKKKSSVHVSSRINSPTVFNSAPAPKRKKNLARKRQPSDCSDSEKLDVLSVSPENKSPNVVTKYFLNLPTSVAGYESCGMSKGIFVSYQYYQNFKARMNMTLSEASIAVDTVPEKENLSACFTSHDPLLCGFAQKSTTVVRACETSSLVSKSKLNYSACFTQNSTENELSETSDSSTPSSQIGAARCIPLVRKNGLSEITDRLLDVQSQNKENYSFHDSPWFASQRENDLPLFRKNGLSKVNSDWEVQSQNKENDSFHDSPWKHHSFHDSQSWEHHHSFHDSQSCEHHHSFHDSQSCKHHSFHDSPSGKHHSFHNSSSLANGKENGRSRVRRSRKSKLKQNTFSVLRSRENYSEKGAKGCVQRTEHGAKGCVQRKEHSPVRGCVQRRERKTRVPSVEESESSDSADSIVDSLLPVHFLEPSVSGTTGQQCFLGSRSLGSRSMLFGCSTNSSHSPVGKQNDNPLPPWSSEFDSGVRTSDVAETKTKCALFQVKVVKVEIETYI